MNWRAVFHAPVTATEEPWAVCARCGRWRDHPCHDPDLARLNGAGFVPLDDQR